VNSGSYKPVTELLSKWESALEHLTPLVYSELQRLARLQRVLAMVKRKWTTARLRLHRELSREGH
jgi:hypothetical protein